MRVRTWDLGKSNDDPAGDRSPAPDPDIPIPYSLTPGLLVAIPVAAPEGTQGGLGTNGRGPTPSRGRPAPPRAVYGAGDAGGFAGEGPARKSPKKWSPRSRAGYERGREEAKALLDAKAAEDIEKPEHLLGVFALMHERVYGVSPDDLADGWKPAVVAVRKMIASFGGEPTRVLDLLRWTWRREAEREKAAAGTGKVRSRLTWRVQFACSALVVDYRRAVVAGNRRTK